jgi:hypothetical protein
LRRRRTVFAALLAVLPAAPAAAADRGYLDTPTDQLAAPGWPAGAEITPEGDVYTGAAEYAFAYGPDLRRWDVPTRERADGRWPVLRSGATAGGVRYRLTTLIDVVAGGPVVFAEVQATNTGGRGTVARWATETMWSGGERLKSGAYAFRFRRPSIPAVPGLYLQPGEAFEPGTQHAVHGGVVTREDRVLYVTDRTPVRSRGGISRKPSSRVGRTELAARLEPGESTTFELRIPVTPRPMTEDEVADLREGTFAEHRATVIGAWRERVAGAAELDLPEPAVRDAWRSAVVQLLEPRYRIGSDWVQPVNKLQYHSFWLRDAAIIAQALDLAGLHEPAAQDLAFFDRWQRADGLFVSREGQLDGVGQALWGLGEHVRLTGDAAFAATWLDPVARAVEWIRAARASDPLNLIPPSDPDDNELVAGHLPGDDFWAVAGLDAAAALADAAGRGDLAQAWRADRDDLAARIGTVLRERGGAIPPALDAAGGRDWGNLWAAWPYPALAPGDSLVTATLRKVRRDFAEGIATYGTSLHGYLGFRVFQTELARGEQGKVVAGLYATLAHLTSTHGCFELGTKPFGSRRIAENLAPHGWCAAELVALVRNMLVREDGDRIALLSALSPRWLGEGRRVALTGAPTRLGPVSVELRSGARGGRLRWSAPVPVRWPLPPGARDVRIDGAAVAGRVADLPASGDVTFTWRLAPRRASLARTKARLARAYERRGASPPF